MDFLRILARVAQYRLARAVLALLLVAVAALFGTSKAHAAEPACFGNGTSGMCDTEAQAYSNVQRAATTACTSASTGNPIGTVSYVMTSYGTTTGFVRFNCTTYQPFPYTRSFPIAGRCPADAPYNPTTGICEADCDSLPDVTTAGPPVSGTWGTLTSGSLYCKNPLSGNASCTMAAFKNADGTWTSSHVGGADCTWETLEDECNALTGFFWSDGLQSCVAQAQECEAHEVKDPATGQCSQGCPVGLVLQEDGTCKTADNECPAGNIKAPSGQCLPGEGQCAAGEAKKPDGTCGKDVDGDGEADTDTPNDETDDSFSGGDSCDVPPSCSGGVIDCGMARIQWRIDCNTRRNENISGGSCNAMPVCTGEKCSAMEYSQLLQTWKAGCHLEKLAGGDDGNDDELVSSGGVLGEDLDPNSVITEVGEDGANGIAFDTSGKGWASSCPQPPTVSLPGGETLTFDTAVFCDWMNLGGIFVMIMAHLAGLAIVVRS